MNGSRDALKAALEICNFDGARDALGRFLDERNNSVASTEFAWRTVAAAGQRLGMIPLKIVLASSFTLEPVAPFLGTSLFSNKRLLSYLPVPYTRWHSALSTKSDIDDFDPDVVFLLLHTEDVLPKLSAEHLVDPDGLAEEKAAFLETLKSAALAFRGRSNTPLVVNTLTFMQRGVERYFDWGSGVSRQQILDEVNRELATMASTIPNTRIYDYAGIVSDVGRNQWYDRRGDAMRRTAIAPGALPIMAKDLARFVGAMVNPRKKGLVVDLDNTLWGGIVGENGPGGILIGGDYPGNAYQQFQHMLRNLRASGVVLAIASKNNEEDVREAFTTRAADMAVADEDFSAKQIHWGEKPLSIRAIAEELGIGSDSLVFIDDSPIECGLVNKFAPEVATILMDGDPSGFSEKVLGTGYFDAVALTSEDRQRAHFYRSEAARRELKSELDKDQYLASLSIGLQIHPPTTQELERVVQLVNKTNQFNLTTQRYSRSDVLGLMHSREHDVYVGKLQDRFGSYGLICVCILEQRSDECVIDTLLMSCRILGRGAENAILAHMEKRARDRGVKRLVGRYLPTPKNRMVKDFYAEQGFTRVNDELFLRDLAQTAPMAYPSFIHIETSVDD